ncbi:hypothetical protein [Amycolatopsis sp. NPDC059657]|uniref:hypothetical protein n=1 Tax=Amycolatopsis sp. NPDC059657 TaxID=3346899 RepID=UPI00366F2D11
MTALADPAPSPEFDLLTGEAYIRYRAGLDDTQRHDLELYEHLSTHLRRMRVLYLAYLDLDIGLLPDDVTIEDHTQADTDGLVFTSGRRMRLTRDGFAQLWQWKAAIEPHIRKPQFQALWRRVMGW